MLRQFLTSGSILVFLPMMAAGVAQGGDRKSAVYAAREAKTGVGSLKVDGYLLRKVGRPRELSALSLWRYDPDNKAWSRFDVCVEQPIILKPDDSRADPPKPDRELIRIPAEFGLFWAEWREDDRWSDRLVPVGPVLCNDVEIGNPPEGMVATCVPFADHARAMLVPDPKLHCRPAPAELLQTPGPRDALASLRAHDQSAFRASPQVLDAARRVFAEVRLEGRTPDDVEQILGPPLEKKSMDGKQTWTYRYHNGEAGVVRRLWFDHGKVSKAQPILTE